MTNKATAMVYHGGSPYIKNPYRLSTQAIVKLVRGLNEGILRWVDIIEDPPEMEVWAPEAQPLSEQSPIPPPEPGSGFWRRRWWYLTSFYTYI